MIYMTRREFLNLDPHYRTHVGAPKLVTRQLVDRTILAAGVEVTLVPPAPVIDVRDDGSVIFADDTVMKAQRL